MGFFEKFMGGGKKEDNPRESGVGGGEYMESRLSLHEFVFALPKQYPDLLARDLGGGFEIESQNGQKLLELQVDPNKPSDAILFNGQGEIFNRGNISDLKDANSSLRNSVRGLIGK